MRKYLAVVNISTETPYSEAERYHYQTHLCSCTNLGSLSQVHLPDNKHRENDSPHPSLSIFYNTLPSAHTQLPLNNLHNIYTLLIILIILPNPLLLHTLLHHLLVLNLLGLTPLIKHHSSCNSHSQKRNGTSDDNTDLPVGNSMTYASISLCLISRC